MQAQRIRSIKKIGKIKTLDFEVDHSDHNFYAEGIVVSNSHAVGYGYLTAITAYLKGNHPKEFFLALLKNAKNEQDPIAEIAVIQSELPAFDIRLLPPDLMKSDWDFKMEGKDIRYGLSSIKGISEKSLQRILDFRKPYATKFEVFQGADEADVPLGVLSALIQAGTLEDYSKSRSRLVLEAQLWRVLTKRERPLAIKWGKEHNSDLFYTVLGLQERKNDKGKPLLKESRVETIKKKLKPYKDIYAQNHRMERFANWWYETTLIGFSYSQRLREIFKTQREDILSIAEVRDEEVDQRVLFAARVKEYKRSVSSSEKKTKYVKLEVNDETGGLTVLYFNDTIESIKNRNNGKIPKDGDIVVVDGVKKEDAVFANDCHIQDNQIYTKLAQIKREKNECN